MEQYKNSKDLSICKMLGKVKVTEWKVQVKTFVSLQSILKLISEKFPLSDKHPKQIQVCNPI